MAYAVKSMFGVNLQRQSWPNGAKLSSRRHLLGVNEEN